MYLVCNVIVEFSDLLVIIVVRIRIGDEISRNSGCDDCCSHVTPNGK